MSAMLLVLAAALALIPLGIAPGALFYFDVTPKILVLTVAAAAVLLLEAVKPSRPERASRALVFVFAAQWISVAISTALSNEPALSLGGSSWRRLGLAAWTGILLLGWAVARRSTGEILSLLRATVIAAVGIAAYAIFQYFGIDPWLPASAYHIGEGEWTIVRPPGTLGYVTYLANWMLCGVFAGAALAGTDRSRGWRWTGIAAAALGSTAIVLSGTRGAALGLLAGTVFSMRRIAIRKMVAGGAAAVVLLAAFYVSPAGLKLRSRTRWYVEDPAGGARLWLWRDALRMSAARLAAGAGPEAFPVEFPRFQSIELARRYPDFHHESPHNMFLDSLTGQGIAGLAIMIAAVLLGFRFAWRTRLPALTGMFVATVVAHQFACFTAPTALFFFVSLALLAAGSGELEPGGRASAEHGPSAAWPLAVAIPAAALLTVFAARLVVADRNLWLTAQQVKNGMFSEAARSYRVALTWAPPGFSADLWYSRAMAAGSRQEALEAGLRATRNAEDRQNAWYSLAMLRAAQNDFSGTEQALRSAIEAAPNWYRPHRALALLLRHAGRAAEADEESALADARSAKTAK